MTRFAFVALCVITTFLGTSALTSVEYGMTMTTNAYDAVCWYEHLKKFPDTNTNSYMGNCYGQAKEQQNQIQSQKDNPDKMAEYYADAMEGPMGGLPADYKTKCEKYLKNPKAEPISDEGDGLNDKNKENGYPFKGLAYCLIKVLRERHGNKAIEDVKNERTHKFKNWRKTMLDRDNEFRARHGAQPFQLVKELNDAAQEWAEVNAKECNMHHSENSDPRRQWKGEGTGESLSGGGDVVNDRIAAYIASDGWYEEIKNYPYPEYKGDGSDDLFMKIGHFTQTVWKETKFVGYGFAYNPKCTDYQFIVAARYSPAGNMPGEYGKNVAPPK